MARLILNTGGGNPEQRIETLQGLFGSDITVVPRQVILRERPRDNISTAVTDLESNGDIVVGVIVPQNVMGDLQFGDAIRADIPLLREDFVRGGDGRVLVVGKDAESGRDILQVGGYSRLVKAELRTTPIDSGTLTANTGRVYMVSRHTPQGRQEVIDAAFGQAMELIVEDLPFNGDARRAIGDAIDQLGGVDAVIVVKSVLKDLRFGDAFGQTPILTEIQKRADQPGTGDAPDVHRFVTAGREAGGRDQFIVEKLERFAKAELVMEEMKPGS